MTELHAGMGEMVLGIEGDTLIALGLGSCVCVNIYDPITKIAGAAHVMLPDSTGFPQALQKTVLIADANDQVRQHLTRVLTAYDFTIAGEAAEKEQTITIYRQRKPAVSLISACLPPSDWNETVRSLLEIDRNANVVIISPTVDRNAVLRYLSSGASDVIIDPFTDHKIISSVEYALNKRSLKYADKAIPLLKARMMGLGAHPKSMVAKIVGGAHMFPTIEDERILQIGKRNIEAVKAMLAKEGIALVAEDTGSHIGRTSRFDVTSGMLTISTKEGQKVV